MQNNRLTLKRQLLWWLLLPQLLFWLTGASLSYLVTTHYVNSITDQALQQTANYLIRLIPEQGGEKLEKLPALVRTMLDDGSENAFYFTIRTPLNAKPVGNRTLPLPTDPPPQRLQPDTPLFYNTLVDDAPLRTVLLLHHENGKPYQIQVAQSLHPRNRLSQEIFFAISIPLALLILVTSLLVWWGIGRGLRPLAQLQKLVGKREAQDMSPVTLAHAPEEVTSLTEALNRLLKATNASISRQRRFIADAAHQLRTPLAGLKSQTELAMRETDPAMLRERLQMVHTSATRSIHLVNQLLTLARSEPGSQAGIPKVAMDLAKLMREITSEAVPRAIAAGVDLGCELRISDAPIQGNSALLREMMLNLVDNAIKYIPRGSSITVRLDQDVSNYIIMVEDDGPGIPEADRERVFERFYRREQTGNGCGLGMAIVKEIAERHAGSVTLNETQPHGLTVLICIPRPKAP